MSPQPSSTSSSNLLPRLKVLGWQVAGFIAVILVFDVVIATAYSLPEGQETPENPLQRYFATGQSLEGKIRRSVGPPGEEPYVTNRLGWISTEILPPPKDWSSAETRIIFYGNSFTRRMRAQAEHLQPSAATVSRYGPSAPINHTYALFEQDPLRPEASMVVVGVLSKSMPYIQSIAWLSASFDNPTPYTFPKYYIEDGELRTITPKIITRDRFIQSVRDQGADWQLFIDDLKKHDPGWDRFLFAENFTDEMASLRLLRRAWSRRAHTSLEANVYSESKGYNLENRYIQAVPLLLEQMYQQSVHDQQKFLVALFHAQGEPGHLEGWLGAELEKRGIPYISSADHFSAMDPSNFISDGHYSDENDAKLAHEVLRRAALPKSGH